jgi:hypothetical protein
MKTSRVKGKIVCGVIFIVAGFVLALNGLVSGPHAFWGGVSGVAGLCIAGLLLAGAGGRLIYEATHNG